MDRKPFRILAVAGSLRQGSYNRGLLRAAEALAPDWVEVRFFDIGQLPFFNEDVEAAGDPEPVRRFKDAIATSNAVLIATPEYNGVVPGVLANAIDWASQPTGRSVLRNKPVAVMGAVLGKSGSANAQAVLRGVLGRIGAIVVPDPQVLVPHTSRLSASNYLRSASIKRLCQKREKRYNRLSYNLNDERIRRVGN